VMLQPAASLRPVMTKLSCTSPSLVPFRFRLKRASRTGPFCVMNLHLPGEQPGRDPHRHADDSVTAVVVLSCLGNRTSQSPASPSGSITAWVYSRTL
jgi:hypothetical protein